MGHTDTGLCSSHELLGWSFSLWSPHTPRSHRACTGPTRRMHPAPSEWPHVLPGADPQKGRVRSRLTATVHASFFLSYYIAQVRIRLDGRTS
jgi:hypothetical protein